MLTQADINNLRVFLGRASLTGNEVGTFVELANKLTLIELSLQPKARRGNKDLSSASQ